MTQILSSFGKKGVDLGLDTLQVDIEDTSFLSKYFVIAEFNPVFSAGKNPVSFNGSSLLAEGSEIKIECLDSAGNSLYIESPKSNIQYVDVAKFVISISIFNETYNGAGKLIFVGTTVKNEIVRWIGNITIDKTLQNTSKVRFYNKPTLESHGILYPVITNDVASALTKVIPFTGSFFTIPAKPLKDTKKSTIDLKKTDIDYRLTLIPDGNVITPTLFPTSSFNTQMEGQNISINVGVIQIPSQLIEREVNATASFKVKKVLNSTTIQLDDAFYVSNGKDSYVTTVNLGNFTSSYTWIAYNTQSDAYLHTSPNSNNLVKQSYAEVLYRNIKPFSGFVARHKLYRKSLAYPGDFQLIADEPLGALELLTDPVTANKSYPLMGSFYNQFHINKYWFTSSTDLNLSHSVTPYIDSMKIYASSPDLMDGGVYVMVKADSSGSNPNDGYVPYSHESFVEMSGSSYSSNFISLKAGVLYALSTNIIIEKNQFEIHSEVTFYLTSSIPEIRLEKDFSNVYGLKLGSISVSDQTPIKNFSDKQYMYFTPTNDYYGTLVIVPYHCNVTLAQLSLKVYGDYGFSPDIMFTKIPFKLNVAGETFQLKAELFDINSTLIFSDLNTIATFDPKGESLFTFIGNSNVDPSLVSFISASLTVSESLYLPNIPGCPQNGIRFLGWHDPLSSPPSNTDGELCYTNVTNISNIGNNYINLGTVNGVTPEVARSISVKYTGSGAPGGQGGKHIYVDAAGVKTTEP